MQAFHQDLANSGRFRATVLPTGEGSPRSCVGLVTS
jgi:hypothetical protein